jgi:hypothetical protein
LAAAAWSLAERGLSRLTASAIMAAECKPSPHILALVKQAEIPTPSGAVLKRLAGVAVHVEEWLAADQPAGKAPVGLTRIKNDRRRSLEQILVLLADSELKSYLAEVRALVS